MRIAITDANIFIDLTKLKALQHLFVMDLEIITTREVYDELYEWQQELLATFVTTGKLTIHSFSAEEWELLSRLPDRRGLTQQDKTVLFLAQMKEAIVLSGDGPLRKHCKELRLEVRGILWILERFITHKLVTHQEAVTLLNELQVFNSRLPAVECEQKRKEWMEGR